MGERLATDIFNFAGTELRITRRDLAGPGSDDDESDDEFVDPYFFDEGYTAGFFGKKRPSRVIVLTHLAPSRARRPHRVVPLFRMSCVYTYPRSRLVYHTRKASTKSMRACVCGVHVACIEKVRKKLRNFKK